MSERICPVIVCGGSGTRLWPVSRETMPKQFAPLLGARSTFQETVLRVADPERFAAPVIVAARAQHFTIERQLRELKVEATLLLEPTAMDSAPAIMAGTIFVAETDPNALVLMLAADHLVRDVASFQATVLDGVPAARQGSIVTFGVSPSFPATGFGYIEAGDPAAGRARQIVRFVEKPDAPTAAQYILDGYYWNSGNILFKASAMIEAYEKLDRASAAAIHEAVAHRSRDLAAFVLEPSAFGRATKSSIDDAVMSKTALGALVQAAFDWSDIGSWDALWSVGDKDRHGNVVEGDIRLVESSDCYVRTDGQLTTLLGVKDLVVVATQDAILVSSKMWSGEVKSLVEQLKKEARSEATEHPKVFRPWGWFQTLDLGGRFRVKRIVVYPKGRLSLQRHHHRAKHWVVVTGTAVVTIGTERRMVGENQSVFIPLGEVHRLENPGMIDLEVIEVQTGSYLGEDDIVRIEDAYDRIH